MKNFLTKCFLFKNWNESEIEALVSISQEKSLNLGQILFNENEKADALFVVKSGAINIEKHSGGETEYITHLESGSYFGELGILGSEGQTEKRSATSTAREKCELIKISYSDLEKLLNQHPEAGSKFYRNVALALSIRIKKTTQDLASLKSLRLRHL
jgi:CRP-like cAMP-binding protein